MSLDSQSNPMDDDNSEHIKASAPRLYVEEGVWFLTLSWYGCKIAVPKHTMEDIGWDTIMKNKLNIVDLESGRHYSLNIALKVCITL